MRKFTPNKRVCNVWNMRKCYVFNYINSIIHWRYTHKWIWAACELVRIVGIHMYVHSVYVYALCRFHVNILKQDVHTLKYPLSWNRRDKKSIHCFAVERVCACSAGNCVVQFYVHILQLNTINSSYNKKNPPFHHSTHSYFSRGKNRPFNFSHNHRSFKHITIQFMHSANLYFTVLSARIIWWGCGDGNQQHWCECVNLMCRFRKSQSIHFAKFNFIVRSEMVKENKMLHEIRFEMNQYGHKREQRRTQMTAHKIKHQPKNNSRKEKERKRERKPHRK